MKKKLVVANWKAYVNTPKDVSGYFKSFRSEYSPKNILNVEVVFLPPFPYIGEVTNILSPLGIETGAQDAFWEAAGAYTGEVTPTMVKAAGATWALLGHSERRRHFKETDEMVNKKIHASIAAKVKAILCVGEWERARDDAGEKKILDFVKGQLYKALFEVKKEDIKKIVIAYEPVWAISGNNGEADTPQNAARMIMFARRIIAQLYDAKTAKDVRILYGGSVSSANAGPFTREEMIDGVLVGRASSVAKEFLEIIKKANEHDEIRHSGKCKK